MRRTIKLIIGRINQQVHCLKGVKTEIDQYEKFPKNIESYTFSREVKQKESCSGYRFALYKDKEGKVYLAKAWIGKYRGYLYYGLENEIAAFLLIHKAMNSQIFLGNRKSFLVPKIYKTYQDKNRLVFIMEKIENIKNITNSDLPSEYDE
ncbi:hypothetical protein ACFL1Q_02095, partial [Patescibacteria group bacterium]